MTPEQYVLALCLWREARGESREAQTGVAWVLRNRIAKRFRGKDAIEVVLWPYQFSSFNANDPNARKFPRDDDKAFAQCLAVVQDPGPDPTGGALMYHDASVHPNWAEASKMTAAIGAFRFYRA
jgi:spore germination cell wall hydrolase CwlJ-like protein